MLIGIITNFNIPEKCDTALKAVLAAAKAGAATAVPLYVNTLEGARDGFVSAGTLFLPVSEIYRQADAVITVGGDGTLMEAAKRSAERGTLLLGINRGRVGYMTELEPRETELIAKLVSGEYKTEERFIMNVRLTHDGEVLYEGLSFNDAVLYSGVMGKMIETELKNGEDTVGIYRADGIIIATPTGSTAYSLSAGGPVIDPVMNCFCMTPICAHSPDTRPCVFDGTSRLSLSYYGKRNPELALSVDGRFACKMTEGSVLTLCDSGKRAHFIRIKPRQYYQTLCRKIEGKFSKGD